MVTLLCGRVLSERALRPLLTSLKTITDSFGFWNQFRWDDPE